MKQIEPRVVSKVPAAEHGWFATQYAILLDGSLARLEATFDIQGAIKARWERAEVNQPLGPWPPFPPDARERLTTFNGNSVTATSAFPVEEVHAKFDRLPSGHWIVAEVRCGIVPSNARSITSTGEVVARSLLGDGIQDLQCDPDGCTWVGYFDEGIFGNNGWGEANGPSPVGMTGLNRFDESGKILWPERDALGQTSWPLPFIADCYVLNVTPDAVFICPYTDFPVTRIGYDGFVRTWTNAKCGADILVVDQELAILLGGYEDKARHGVLLRLGDETAEPIGEFEIDIDVRFLRDLPLACGRCDTMHFIVDDKWCQLTVQDVMRQLS